MAYDDIIPEYHRIRRKYPHWREGQAWFNALATVHPELADKLRGQPYDPYYDSSKLDSAIQWTILMLGEPVQEENDDDLED